MIVFGIILIIAGIVGYFYTRSEMRSLEYSLESFGHFLGVSDTPMLDILNMISIIAAVLGLILLIVGIVKMVKD